MTSSGRHLQVSQVTESDLTLEGWVALIEDGFPGVFGPVWQQESASGLRFGVLTSSKHANRNGAVHGGALLSLADQALGYTSLAHIGSGRQATIQLDLHFLRPVFPGDFVVATGSVIRATRTIVFVRGELTVNDTVCCTATGVWKQLYEAPGSVA